MKSLVDSPEFSSCVDNAFGPSPYTRPLMEEIFQKFTDYVFSEKSADKGYTVTPITDTLLAIRKTFTIRETPCDVVILFRESATEIHRLSLTISAIPLAAAA